MKPELRLEDSIILSTSRCTSAPPTFAALVAGWPIEFHSCQTTSVRGSAPGLSADGIHFTVYLHHKATLVLEAVATDKSQESGRDKICACSADRNVTNNSPHTALKQTDDDWIRSSPAMPGTSAVLLFFTRTSSCFLISLQRHRALKYRARQWMNSLIQQRSQTAKN